MKVLIVDDNKDNLYLVETILKGDGFKVISAENGAEGLKKLKAGSFDMIISDILMPIMDGYMFCTNVRKIKKFDRVPFIFYTATYLEKKDEELALKLGADKFIRKPIDPDEFLKIIRGIAKNIKKKKIATRKPALVNTSKIYELYSKRLVNKMEKKVLDLKKEITKRIKAEDEIKNSYRKLQKTLKGIVDTLASIVEIRDPYTSGHQKRVAALSSAISKELDLGKDKIEAIGTAAIIHDIGKINIPASILVRPGKISSLEYNMIKTHSQVGYEMVKRIEFPWPIANIIFQHHERLDGSGYPKGLKGKDILFEAKIIAVADVVEAMSSHRPYRPALGMDKALEEITKNKGKLYDPGVVEACIKIITKKGFKF